MISVELLMKANHQLMLDVGACSCDPVMGAFFSSFSDIAGASDL